MKTIAKFSVFVILIGLFVNTFAGCSFTSLHKGQDAGTGPKSPFAAPRVAGKIDSKDITESSGIAASKCQPGVFWTHNDSGDDAFIFAINEKGDNLGTWRVQNAENIDWEDIGGFRDVYRVSEPIVSDKTAGTNFKAALDTEPADQLKFSYSDHNSNAEALMVHPVTGDIYILTKRFDGPSGIYKIKPSFGSNEVTIAEKLGELTVPNVPNGYLTGGDISPDGKHVAVCDYTAAYELSLPANSSAFDDIWKQTPVTIDRGELEQGEAVGYTADGNSLILTSENKHSPVILVSRR